MLGRGHRDFFGRPVAEAETDRGFFAPSAHRRAISTISPRPRPSLSPNLGRRQCSQGSHCLAPGYVELPLRGIEPAASASMSILLKKCCTALPGRDGRVDPPKRSSYFLPPLPRLVRKKKLPWVSAVSASRLKTTITGILSVLCEAMLRTSRSSGISALRRLSILRTKLLSGV